ncbi:unnamed protein product [Toxocara canis]|uniref:PDZ domain-containing protein n=1 Tax=Toxocara canis TaxID=6265 RepID=A0A183V8N0_TOXCA|nr:unnamed protein product [Toxocara canis]
MNQKNGRGKHFVAVAGRHSLVFKEMSNHIIDYFTEPAALYVLWPAVLLILIVQLLLSDSEQPKSVFVTEKVEVIKERRTVAVDVCVETEPITFETLKAMADAEFGACSVQTPKRKTSRNSMIPKECHFEEQTTFIDTSVQHNDDLDMTLLNPTMTSFVSRSDKSLLALPKVGIHIVRFDKSDFEDGIGLVTAVKGDSLIVKKVLKGSASCGRIYSGDRISAVNGNSICFGEKSGEVLQSVLNEAISKREPFEITIVMGSRLEDVGMSRTSCSFLPGNLE